ncbi:hypothetical protein PAPYR_9770 [Paratrimastix pyriformis]|uniref:Uncharacterized protein n=1 Tax=Paratrimastix pyriformis TaxID=342808 RepID=A0ABQ8U7I9_9EUKA|nr:hypothetical protein PAPYR_9770 [Paratrimastix pyriformis]
MRMTFLPYRTFLLVLVSELSEKDALQVLRIVSKALEMIMPPPFWLPGMNPNHLKTLTQPCLGLIDLIIGCPFPALLGSVRVMPLPDDLLVIQLMVAQWAAEAVRSCPSRLPPLESSTAGPLSRQALRVYGCLMMEGVHVVVVASELEQEITQVVEILGGLLGQCLTRLRPLMSRDLPPSVSLDPGINRMLLWHGPSRRFIQAVVSTASHEATLAALEGAACASGRQQPLAGQCRR